MGRKRNKRGYSIQFERDYSFYFDNRKNFTFSASDAKIDYSIQLPGEPLQIDVDDQDNPIEIPFRIPYSKDGRNAKECFFKLDSEGKGVPCSEPELLIELLSCKAAVNFQIKQWAEGRADFTLSFAELQEYVSDYPDWVLKAVEAQADKHIKDLIDKKKYKDSKFDLYSIVFYKLDKAYPIVFKCKICKEQHVATEKDENGVWKLPLSITTDKDKDQQWYLKCANFCRHEMIKPDKIIIISDPVEKYSPFERKDFHPVSKEDMKYLLGEPMPIKPSIPVTIDEQLADTIPMKAVSDIITLYRPIGGKEYELIRSAHFKEFPTRLMSQPIFYPVLNEEYAIQIARDWNTKDKKNGNVGYVTRFLVRQSFLKGFDVHTVGSSTHKEYWIPAEQLKEFNKNIVGYIEILHKFEGK